MSLTSQDCPQRDSLCHGQMTDFPYGLRDCLPAGTYQLSWDGHCPYGLEILPRHHKKGLGTWFLYPPHVQAGRTGMPALACACQEPMHRPLAHRKTGFRIAGNPCPILILAVSGAISCYRGCLSVPAHPVTPQSAWCIISIFPVGLSNHVSALSGSSLISPLSSINDFLYFIDGPGWPRNLGCWQWCDLHLHPDWLLANGKTQESLHHVPVTPVAVGLG